MNVALEALMAVQECRHSLCSVKKLVTEYYGAIHLQHSQGKRNYTIYGCLNNCYELFMARLNGPISLTNLRYDPFSVKFAEPFPYTGNIGTRQWLMYSCQASKPRPFDVSGCSDYGFLPTPTHMYKGAYALGDNF